MNIIPCMNANNIETIKIIIEVLMISLTFSSPTSLQYSSYHRVAPPPKISQQPHVNKIVKLTTLSYSVGSVSY